MTASFGGVDDSDGLEMWFVFNFFFFFMRPANRNVREKFI